jgi:hypothetical protein
VSVHCITCLSSPSKNAEQRGEGDWGEKAKVNKERKITKIMYV